MPCISLAPTSWKISLRDRPHNRLGTLAAQSCQMRRTKNMTNSISTRQRVRNGCPRILFELLAYERTRIRCDVENLSKRGRRKESQIRSTYRRLSEAMADDNDHGILIGTVALCRLRNRSVARGYICAIPLQTYKFDYEREIRAVHLAQDTSNMKVGHRKARQWFQYLSIYNKLVETVYVSPKASAWFADVVSRCHRPLWKIVASAAFEYRRRSRVLTHAL